MCIFIYSPLKMRTPFDLVWENGLQLEDLPGRLVHLFLSSQKKLDFYGRVLYPVCERLACIPPYIVLGYCRVGEVGQLFDSCSKLLQGFSDTLGPHF
jgi:hypothetical protein